MQQHFCSGGGWINCGNTYGEKTEKLNSLNINSIHLLAAVAVISIEALYKETIGKRKTQMLAM